MAQPDGKRKSEKFPPPHQDGAVGVPQDLSNNSPLSFNPTDASFNLSLFSPKFPKSVKGIAAVEAKSRRKRSRRDQPMMISAWKSIQVFKPKSNGRSVDLMFKAKRSVP